MPLDVRAESRGRTAPLLALMLASLIALLAAAPALAQYRLAPGDTIRFAVTGLPELRTEARIDSDGLLRLPHANTVEAAGLTLEELRARVAARVAARPFRRFDDNGQPVLIAVGTEDVFVDILAYRPVVVAGQVARPGAVEYRPGLTARAAIAIAGGAGVGLQEAVEPGRAAELRAEVDVLSRRVAELTLAEWRLRAELAEAPERRFEPRREVPVSQAVLNRLQENHRNRLQLAVRSADQTRAFLERSIRQAGNRIKVLEQQAENARKILEIEDAELERLTGLREQGLLQADRLSEARRAQLATQTRLLQTSDAISQMTLTRGRLERDLAAFESDRRTEILRQIAEAEQGLAEARARLLGTETRLLLAGANLGELPTRPEIRLTVTRGGEALEDVALDDPVLPGDVVTVTLETPALR